MANPFPLFVLLFMWIVFVVCRIFFRSYHFNLFFVMHKKTVSVPVDLEPVYFVCGTPCRGYSSYPARLVTKFKFEVVRERYHIYCSRHANNALGYRARFIRDVKMSANSLAALRKLYSLECISDSDLPF